MFKQWVRGLLVLVLSALANAADVNQASEADLLAVKGIGAALSQRILEERGSAPFKDWADLIARVKGVGETRAAQFSADGLTVNGASYPGGGAAAEKPAATGGGKP